MNRIHLILPAAAALLVASCANQPKDEYDTLGYEFDDYGTPDGTPGGAPYQEVNPTYDSAPAYEETSPAPTTPTTPARAETRHTVVRGDTLWGISRKYGVPIEAIKQANNMRNDIAVLGTTLVIPAR